MRLKSVRSLQKFGSTNASPLYNTYDWKRSIYIISVYVAVSRNIRGCVSPNAAFEIHSCSEKVL